MYSKYQPGKCELSLLSFPRPAFSEGTPQDLISFAVEVGSDLHDINCELGICIGWIVEADGEDEWGSWIGGCRCECGCGRG